MTELSVIVVCHDMRREAPRTLFSLSRDYQRGIADLDYEVVVVDNGSTQPLDPAQVRSFGPQFRHMFHPTRAVSPVEAINAAVASSRGGQVAICIDGARIHSPGMLDLVRKASSLHPRTLAATLAWHLGDKPQRLAMLEGYDQSVEDRLLDSVDWRRDGYTLFSIACLGGSSGGGWFAPIAESSCLAMTRAMFDELGGYDPGFASAGGGYANIDFYARACALPDSQLVVLLGEGTFHQFHGGAATGSGGREQARKLFADEYARLRGRAYVRPVQRPLYLGTLPPVALRFVASARP